MSATAQGKETTAAGAERELTDGFNLIIDAMKLNGLNTIYGVPGIPITDFGRMAQAAGIRVISFRHEQNAGNAAARIELPVSGDPYFWNGKDQFNHPLDPGLYSFELENHVEGEIAAIDVLETYSKVTEARNQSGEMVLIMRGGLAVSTQSVTGLRDPSD